MSARQIAFFLFIVAAVLMGLAVIIPEAAGRLRDAALALAFAGFAFELGSAP